MENRGHFIERIYTYIGERFPLKQFIPLSLIFGIHASLFAQFFLKNNYNLLSIALSSVALFLFLFRLRLFDEFKDYEHDKEHYSERPIPRGLITLAELKFLVLVVIILEVLLSFYFGVVPFVFFVFALLYSLLLFKEFFAKDWLREHFTAYIIIHEVLAIPIFYYIYSINLGNFEFVSGKYFLIHSLLLTISFFTLEVARKIRPKELEISSKDTYTAQYGILGATRLLIGIAIVNFSLAVIILVSINNLSILPILIALIGLYYLALAINNFRKNPNIKTSKKVFLWSIIFTVLVNFGMIIPLWLNR